MKRLLLSLFTILALGISLQAQESKSLDLVGTWKYNGDSGKGEIEFLPDSSFTINARMTRSFDGWGTSIAAAVNVKGKGMWAVEGDSLLSRVIDVESLKIEIINVNVPGVDPALVEQGIWMAKSNAMEPVKNWLHEHPEILTSLETITSVEPLDQPTKLTTQELRDGTLEKTTYKKK